MPNAFGWHAKTTLRAALKRVLKSSDKQIVADANAPEQRTRASQQTDKAAQSGRSGSRKEKKEIPAGGTQQLAKPQAGQKIVDV